MIDAGEFDYVIAGGGTAGCVVAARLSEDPNVTVCVLEAGPSDVDDPRVLRLEDWMYLLDSGYDWDYLIEPQARGNSFLRHARAKVLGGCSSHNSCIAFWTPKEDLDEWAASGCEGWSSADCWPLIKRLETNDGPGDHHGRDGPVNITSTATLVTVTVHSPLHHGFTEADGTFSPDGRTLAIFARRASISSGWPNHSELALINTRTGALRLVRAARLVTQEDAGWVRWLPGGGRLLAGALLASYAVDARTLAARPFYFFPGNEHDIMDTPDINFSAVVIRNRPVRSSRSTRRRPW